MKRFLSLLTIFILFLASLAAASPARAAQTTPTDSSSPGWTSSLICSLNSQFVPIAFDANNPPKDPCISSRMSSSTNLDSYLSGKLTANNGIVYSPGLLGVTGRAMAYLYSDPIMPSSKEYVADLLGNMGVKPVQSAFAQGTGYTAMSPFLPFWKVFRDVAYSLYIIMFVVVGIMIMLRTKISGQTIVTIQSALPNLLITLVLITFSYAIVGFMIDLMYFLIYFLVYLVAAAGIISDPTKLITRFMSYSAWSVIFAGRNSIISAVAASINSVLFGLGTGGIGALGAVAGVISMAGVGYLIVAVAFAIAMLKLMFALVKAYVMLIVQTITAPLQLLMNALPGSKSFGTWLKTTASYLIPFPVAAAMFIFSAILVGNPADRTILPSLDLSGNNSNPFGIDQSAPLYQNRDKLWLPPFTLTDANLYNADILSLIGFFIFLMTPAAVKMAQEWLQVKESPYVSEAFSNVTGGFGLAMKYPSSWLGTAREEARQRHLMEYQAKLLGGNLSKTQQSTAQNQIKKEDS